MTIRISSLLIFIFLLSSCSTISPTTTETTGQGAQKLSWEQRESLLSRINSWQINGKIAVQSARDSGSASVDWIRRGGSYTISLYGPFGSNAMRLSGQPGHVTVVSPEGKRFSANSPEELLGRVWGYNIPISNLNYWVRGLPVPGLAGQKQFDAANRLVLLSQSGWHIQFLDYVRVGQVELPNKIFMTSS